MIFIHMYTSLIHSSHIKITNITYKKNQLRNLAFYEGKELRSDD